MLQLQSALAPLALPAYLRDFLAQVWSQALVLGAPRRRRFRPRPSAIRRVGRDLVMSVQPKGSPVFRKKFLMQLPPLMKDLNEGMKLIGWPEPAQNEFFGKLLPAHAESLKGQPMTELDHNMLVKQLEAIFATPVPRRRPRRAARAVPEVDDARDRAPLHPRRGASRSAWCRERGRLGAHGRHRPGRRRRRPTRTGPAHASTSTSTGSSPSTRPTRPSRPSRRSGARS